jgi:hypothetical protein
MALSLLKGLVAGSAVVVMKFFANRKSSIGRAFIAKLRDIAAND